MKKLWLPLLFLLTFLGMNSSAYAQNYVVNDVAAGPTGQPLGGATITVCQPTAVGLPCNTLATIYSDAAGTPKSNPFTTDGNGNITFAVAPGNYIYTITKQDTRGYTVVLTAPCVEMSACGGGGDITFTAPPGFVVRGSPGDNIILGMPMSWTTGDLLIGNSAGSVARLGVGTNGDQLTVVAGLPAWVTPSSGTTQVVCQMNYGNQNSGTPLITGDIQPQGSQCNIPQSGTMSSVVVMVDSGASTVELGYRHSGSTTDLTGVLTPTTVGGITYPVVCANVAGTAQVIEGVSVICGTLSNTALNAGDYIETIGGTADGTSEAMSIAVIFSQPGGGGGGGSGSCGTLGVGEILFGTGVATCATDPNFTWDGTGPVLNMNGSINVTSTTLPGGSSGSPGAPIFAQYLPNGAMGNTTLWGVSTEVQPINSNITGYNNFDNGFVSGVYSATVEGVNTMPSGNTLPEFFGYFSGLSFNSDDGLVGEAAGYNSQVGFSNSGGVHPLITSFTHFLAGPFMDHGSAGGEIGTAYGLRVESQQSPGGGITIDNPVGIDVEDQGTGKGIVVKGGETDLQSTVIAAGQGIACVEGSLPSAITGKDVLACDSSTHTMKLSNNGGGFGSIVAGTVSVPQGGTGQTSLTAHGVVIGEGTSGVNVTTAGTAAQCLTSNGASADPTFQNCGGAASTALSGITAATGASTIGSGDNNIRFNWNLSTGAGTGFYIGESGASTATGASLFRSSTLTSSTLFPVQFDNAGNGLRMSTTGVLGPLGSGGILWGGLLNFPTTCTNQFVRTPSASSFGCASVNLTSDVTGVLPIANGGTNTSNAPVKRLLIRVAGCNGSTAAPSFDLPLSGGMAYNCKTDATNGTVQGIMAAAQSTVAYATLVVPDDWASFKSAKILFTTADATSGHTIIFTISTACVAPNAGNTDTPAYNSANAFTTTTIGGGATANALYSTTAGTVTNTGCAAGDILHVKLARTNTDTSTDTAIALTGDLVIAYNGTYQ